MNARRAFLAVLFSVALIGAAAAQFTTMGAGSSRPAAGGAPYTGPGDIVASAKGWWGLRAYNAAYATSLGKLANVCTPLDAVCADVNSDASGNFNLSGTGTLLCNNIGSICTIKTLYDQTGNVNNLAQATAATRPILTVNCLGSRPCMTFAAGQYLRLATFNSSTEINQPFTLSTVFKDTGSSTVTSGVVLASGTTTVAGAGVGLFSNDGAANLIEAFAGSSINVAATNNTWHAVNALFNGASSVLNLDGSANTGAVGAAPFRIVAWIGSDGTPSNFVGAIGEAGIWPVEFSSGERIANASNQQTYWGY